MEPSHITEKLNKKRVWLKYQTLLKNVFQKIFEDTFSSYSVT